MLFRDAFAAEPALFDLLVWEMFIGDGLLRHLDGGLSATVRYRGPDLTSATAAEVAALSEHLAAAIGLLGDGWLLHFDAQRLPAPAYPAAGEHFPDAVTAAIDQERRLDYESGSRFETNQTLTITWTPSRRDRLAFGHSSVKQVAADDDWSLEDFEEQLDELIRQLGTHLRVRRLGSREMLEYLHSCLAGRRQPLALPEYPVDLECLLGVGELHGGIELRLGENHIVPISILNFPECTTPDLLDLGDLAIPARLDVRYIPLDRYTAKTAIAGTRRRWSTANLSLRAFLAFALGGRASTPRFTDRHAPRMADDADDALDALDRDETSAGYVSTTLLTWSSDRALALDHARTLVQELRARGLVVLRETFNGLEALLGSLPGHGRYNCRRPLVLHRAAADLAPTTTVWSGHSVNPHPALRPTGPCLVALAGTSPFFWSLASGDVQHALVAGPVGAGKTTLVNTLIAQYLRYPEAQVFAIDKGWSQYVLCRAANGQHYAPSPDSDPVDCFAPLAHLEGPADLPHAASWVEELLHLQGVAVGPGERAAVHRALELLRQSPHRTLATYAAKLQDRSLREALTPYTTGPFAHLFGGSRSPLREGSLHVVEMEALLPLREMALTPVVLHLFSEIERRLDGRPTLLVIEEAPAYLERALFAGRLRQWLLELRKRNAGVLFVTQLLSSLLTSSLRDAILENCPNRVFLPNAAARDPHAAAAYEAFGLSPRQIDLIARAIPKRQYFLDTPDGSRLLELGLSDGALHLLGTSGPQAREAVDAARAELGSAWVVPYLRRRGHDRLAALIADAKESRPWPPPSAAPSPRS